LSEDERRVADACGMSHGTFATKKALLAESKRAKSRLTDDEREVCRATGMSERLFLREKAALHAGKSASAIAAGRTPHPSSGLVLSHRAVDNAHDEMYSGVFGEAWAKAPDRELLSNAIKELQAFNPDKEDATYDRLVNGVLHARCLLERFAPMPYEEDDDE
jgi:hypothetical protein